MTNRFETFKTSVNFLGLLLAYFFILMMLLTPFTAF